MEKREFKSTPFALFKSEKNTGRTRAGIFSVMGNLDKYFDRVEIGSFTKTFQEHKGDSLHLFNHDFNSPPTASVEDLYEIPKSDLPDEILKQYPDATGGAVVVRSYLDTPRGNEILACLDAGAIKRMSFAYEVPEGKSSRTDEIVDGKKISVRRIKEVRHYESSDVLFPANVATVATLSAPLFKSLAAEVKAGQLDRVELEALADEIKTLLAGFEQPKTDDPIIPPPIAIGAQLQLAKAKLALMTSGL